MAAPCPGFGVDRAECLVLPWRAGETLANSLSRKLVTMAHSLPRALQHAALEQVIPLLPSSTIQTGAEEVWVLNLQKPSEISS